MTFYDTATPPNPHVTASITNLTVTLSSITTNQAIPAVPGYNAATFTPWTGAVDWTAGGPVAYLPAVGERRHPGAPQGLLEPDLAELRQHVRHPQPAFFNSVVANTSAKLEAVQ